MNRQMASPEPRATAASRVARRPSSPVRQAKLALRSSDDALEQDTGSAVDLGVAPQAVPGRDFARVPVGASGQVLPFLQTIQHSFGRHDLSDVRVRLNGAATAEARSLGAEAFTRGSEVTFARSPSLHTAAHEAAHVVQQRSGVDLPGGIGRERDRYEQHADEVADRVVRGQSSEALLDAHPDAAARPRATAHASQPRQAISAAPMAALQLKRIPPNISALLTAAGGGKGANFDANAEGALRLIEHAMEELNPTQRAQVTTARLAGLTEAQFNALPRQKRRIRWTDAILAQFPDSKLGDPGLIDTGPRPATPDAANITKAVTGANVIFDDIATGARDAWLTDVFGAGSVAAAKAKYTKGRAAMNRLHGTGSIVTDRSGYSEEVFLGGLTDPPQTPLDPNQKIRVEKDVIDKINVPTHKNASITTLLHESMHAGNADVHDQYEGFQTETEVNKLTFSSCFEVVPWRILEPANARAFTGQKFIPAGTTVGGVTAPPLTKAEEGAKAASELFREAWTIGLNLHPFYVGLWKKPTDWTVPQARFASHTFDKSLPYWSKVQKLTIHLKSTIDLVSPDEAKHPVSQIDIALSEGLIRRLALGMFILGPLQKQAEITTFETNNSTAAERSAAFPGGAHTNADAERDFLLKLTARHPSVAPMTGNVARDLRVVKELGQLSWGSVLDPRNPASFID